MAGGKCLEHLELLRSNEAYLDALGARRIPDPTTAGDFCRRFDTPQIYCLQSVFNATRLKVWRQQPTSFFAEAIIEADGTMVVTTGECKQGMDINYKGEWGYHARVISLANTGEPLFVVNRSGNRPSHEHAAWYFDQAIALCRKAGFKKITLRGDTDFTQSEHLDRWDKDGVRFVFGIDATDKLYKLAGELPPEAWKVLTRRVKHQVKTAPRQRPENVKQQVVEEREYEDIQALGNFRAMGVPPLMALLQNSDSEVRMAAAQALGKIGPEAKAAIPILATLLSSNSHVPIAATDPVQKAAATALGDIGEVDVSALAQLLKDSEDTEVWRAAIVVVLTTGPQAEAAAPALRSLLKGENLPQIQLAALLGYIGKSAVPTFTQLLNDKDVVVRRRAAEILGFIGPEAKAAVPALVESLKDTDWETRWRATISLGHIGPNARAAVPALIASLKSMGGNYVAEAMEKIGIDVKTDVPALVEVLRDHNQEAARILGNIGPPARAAIPALSESFKDENGVVRCAAALAVWKITAEANTVVPLLTGLLDDKDSSVRRSAAYSLGQIGLAAKPAIPALVKLYDDKDRVSAVVASKALGKIGPAAIPAIVQFLNDKNKNSWVRQQAVYSLWQMGSVAVPSLTELLQEKDDTVRQTAAEALKVIKQFKNMRPPMPGGRT